MKLGTQHLKMAPLVATSLAAAVIFVLAILSHHSSAVDVVPAKDPADKLEEAPPLEKAESHGKITWEELKKQVPQTKEGYFKLHVMELYYTNGDLDVQKLLSGQTIETTGQIWSEATQNSKQPLIKVYQIGPYERLFSYRRYSVLLQFETKPPPLKRHGWVRLVGKPEYKTENGKPSLCLRVTGIEVLSGPPEEAEPEGTTPSPSKTR